MTVCSTQPTEGTLQACDPGSVCFPLTQDQIAQSLGSTAAAAPQGGVGVCAPAPNVLLFPSAQDVPTTM